MSMVMLLALAAAIPDVPFAVQVLQEGKVYVLRNHVDDNPLYTFDQDEPGKSNCNDACAAVWTPLGASENEQSIGKWTVIRRDDGANQWAFEGKPVYSFAQAPEAVETGKGRAGVWHLLPTFPAQ